MLFASAVFSASWAHKGGASALPFLCKCIYKEKEWPDMKAVTTVRLTLRR